MLLLNWKAGVNSAGIPLHARGVNQVVYKGLLKSENPVTINKYFETQRTDIMIFTATEADGPQIVDITARAGVFNQEEVDCVDAIWQEYLTDGPEICGYTFIVDRDGDQVLGFACYGPRDLTNGVYDLYWLAVDPNARRSGAGRRLLTASEEAARQAGARMIIAETSGTGPYDGTRKFYLSTGYIMEATIKDFYIDGDDLAIFVKRFPQHAKS
jgi:ribosomal protein S18 acetylase RimI-like enzyme